MCDTMLIGVKHTIKTPLTDEKRKKRLYLGELLAVIRVFEKGVKEGDHSGARDRDLIIDALDKLVILVDENANYVNLYQQKKRREEKVFIAENMVKIRLETFVSSCRPLMDKEISIASIRKDSVETYTTITKPLERLLVEYNEGVIEMGKAYLRLAKSTDALERTMHPNTLTIDSRTNLDELSDSLENEKGWLEAYIDRFKLKYSHLEEEDGSQGMDIIALNELPLTALQINALKMLSVGATKYSNNIRGSLFIKRAEYIRKSPIIMHLPLLIVLEAMIENNDGYLRNQYETGTTEGSRNMVHRNKWESRIFKGAYDEATPRERVKYATLHLTDDKTGTPSCHQYGGRSYLIFNESVKERSTIAAYDSSNESVQILGTFEHCNHIAMQFQPAEDKYIDKRISGIESPSKNPFNERSFYKEVQIHGDLVFKRDVKKIVADIAWTGKKQMLTVLNQFFDMIGTEIEYEFITTI